MKTEGKILSFYFFCIFLFLFFENSSYAHSIRKQISSYTDNQGLQRERLKLDLTADIDHYGKIISSSTYNVAVSRDYYNFDEEYSNDYIRDVYNLETKIEDSVTLTAIQGWSKITESRLTFGFTKDQAIASRTGGVGLSRWLWYESLQASVDISKTMVKRPTFEILDEDSDILSPPTRQNSTGITTSLKHLATTTTIADYSFAYFDTNDRPPVRMYSLGIKQFIPPTTSAIHTKLSRAINKGQITQDTTYGEVDAWIWELSFLQNLWKGAMSKIAYRYYKEDEISRVNKNHYVRGSDTISIGFAQELPKGAVDSLKNSSLTIETSATRYLTNKLENGEKLAANIYEIRLLSKF